MPKIGTWPGADPEEPSLARGGPALAGRVGLQNLGNTCFMNAGLQCLTHLEPLSSYFLTGAYDKEINRDTGPLGCNGNLAEVFAELQKGLWRPKKGVTSQNPRKLRQTLKGFAPHLFEGYQQQDIQEFLAFCLDALHEDVNRVRSRPPPLSEEDQKEDDRQAESQGEEFAAALAWQRYLERGKSYLVDLMQGQLRSSLVCSTCGNRSRRFEPFLYLSVPVTREMEYLTDTFSAFVKEETLTGDEQWFCEKCKCKVDACKRIDIWKMPPVLVLHLKRFEFDAKTYSFKKIGTRLVTELNVDLSNYLSSSQSGGAMYEVVAVANHLGSFGSGHYTATCRVGDKWFYFDDDKVRQLAPGADVVTNQAYIIFLERRSVGSEAQGSKPGVRFRTQTLSFPENWPHRLSTTAIDLLRGRMQPQMLPKRTARSRSFARLLAMSPPEDGPEEESEDDVQEERSQKAAEATCCAGCLSGFKRSVLRIR